MAEQPLTAPYRATLTVQVLNLIHKIRMYCEAAPSIADPSGFMLYDRLGLATISPGTAFQDWWTVLRPEYDTTITAAPWLLEQRSGLTWNAVASGSNTGNGTAGGAIQQGGQVTVSCRTEDFQRLKMVFLETNYVLTSPKNYGFTGLNAVWPFLAASISGSGGGVNLSEWARSRNTKKLNGNGPIISTTVDLNDKVRRSRGLQ